MAEQTKKRSMTTDTTSKISENPKKKTQNWHSDEGKQSKKESDCERGHCLDLSVVLQLSFTAIRCRQRTQNLNLWDYPVSKI